MTLGEAQPCCTPGEVTLATFKSTCRTTASFGQGTTFPVEQGLDRLARKHGLVFRQGDQGIVPPEAISLRKILLACTQSQSYSLAMLTIITRCSGIASEQLRRMCSWHHETADATHYRITHATVLCGCVLLCQFLCFAETNCSYRKTKPMLYRSVPPVSKRALSSQFGVMRRLVRMNVLRMEIVVEEAWPSCQFQRR